MRFHARLTRLERTLEARRLGTQESEPEISLFDLIRATAAYLGGVGPRPPRKPYPSGCDPSKWEVRMEEYERRMDERRDELIAERRDALLASGLTEATVERELCGIPLSGDSPKREA